MDLRFVKCLQTSHETSFSISPDAIEPVTLDQNDVLLGTIGPLCDTPMSSNMCGIDSVSTPAGEPKLIYCMIKFIINLSKQIAFIQTIVRN